MSEETRIQLNVCDWKLNSEECTRRIFFSFLLFFFFFFLLLGLKESWKVNAGYVWIERSSRARSSGIPFRERLHRLEESNVIATR